mgnify:CR=1 FL=1
MHNKQANIRMTLVLLWIVVMVNMLFADIFGIMVELVEGNTLNIPGDVKTVMAIAAVVTNVPILMIILSWVLPYKANRLANISAALFTILYVIGGGSSMPHYLIIASIEVVLLVIIFIKALKWRTD